MLATIDYGPFFWILLNILGINIITIGLYLKTADTTGKLTKYTICRAFVVLSLIVLLIIAPYLFINVIGPFVCSYDDKNNNNQIIVDQICTLAEDTTLVSTFETLQKITTVLLTSLVVIFYRSWADVRNTLEDQYERMEQARARIVQSVKITAVLIVPLSLMCYDIFYGMRSIIILWNKFMYNLILVPMVVANISIVLETLKGIFLIASKLNTVACIKDKSFALLFVSGIVIVAPVILAVVIHEMIQWSNLNTNIGGPGPQFVVAISLYRLLSYKAKDKAIMQAEEEVDEEKKQKQPQTTETINQNEKSTATATMPSPTATKQQQQKKKSKSCRVCTTPGTLAHAVMFRIPFTYSFALLVVVYLMVFVNIMFHLLVSALANESFVTSFMKVVVLFLTGWNMTPLLKLLISLTIDSWTDLDQISFSFLENVFHLRHLIEKGIVMNYEHIPMEILMMESLNAFKDLDLDGDGELNMNASTMLRRGSGHRRKSVSGMFDSTKNAPNKINIWDADTDKDGAITKNEYIKWVSSNKTQARLISERMRHASHKGLVQDKVDNVLTSLGKYFSIALFLVVVLAKFQAHVSDLDDDLMNVIVNDSHVVIDHMTGRNTMYRQDMPIVLQKPGKPAYQICQNNWHGLSIFDYSLLTNMVYVDHTNEKDLNQIDLILQASFPNSLGYEVNIVKDWNDNNPHRVVDEDDIVDQFDDFILFKFNKLKLKVIAVRGTCPVAAMDVIADIRLWFESSSFNIASAFMPTLKMMSPGMIGRIIYLMNSIQKFFEIRNIELDYYEAVVKYATRLKKELEPGWNLAVTGHSLGAGISTIVGATVGIPSIAFSPPGFVRSRFKFETVVNGSILRSKISNAAQYSVNVLPMRDIVPLADSHFGLIQNTICNYQDPLTCHSIELTSCDLLQRCGDGMNGKRYSGCTFNQIGLVDAVYNMFDEDADDDNAIKKEL